MSFGQTVKPSTDRPVWGFGQTLEIVTLQLQMKCHSKEDYNQTHNTLSHNMESEFASVFLSLINVFVWLDALQPTTGKEVASIRRVAGYWVDPQATPIARFMGPTWGPSGSDRTQMGPMLAPWTLLSGWPWSIQLFRFKSIIQCGLHYLCWSSFITIQWISMISISLSTFISFIFFWIWPDQSDTPDTDLVIGHKNVIA